MSWGQISLACIAAFALAATGCGGDEAETNAPSRPTKRPVRQPQKAPVAADAGADAARQDGGDAAGGEAGDAATPAPAVDRGALWRARRYLARGRSLMEAEQVPAALTELRLARDTLPDEGRLRVELARACLASGDNACAEQEARAALERAGRTVATKADAYEVLGRALSELGRAEPSREAFIEALKLRPSEALASRLASAGVADAGPADAPPLACPVQNDSAAAAIAALEGHDAARGATLCPLFDEPYTERTPDGSPIQTQLIAAFRRHERATTLLADQGGMSVSGGYALLLVRIVREQAEVVVIQDGRDRRRQAEIISSISSSIRRITLGPSRPGLVVEVTSRGWWNVDGDGTPYPFERTELYLIGQHLSRLERLLHQVTREVGEVPTEDCVFGESSRHVERGGAIWLEDIDLSGVPEICQETTALVELPSWLSEEPQLRRTEASCHRWVASALQRSTTPVPSLVLDEFDRERSIRQVVEVSRVPAQIRAGLVSHLGHSPIIAAKALELTRTGMEALAILAGEDVIKALAVSASDNVNILELARIGRWSEVTAAIDASNPELIGVEVTARGDDLDDAAARSWLFLLHTEPGQPPRVVLSQDLYVESRLDADPCPTVVRATLEREDRDGTLYLTFTRRRTTGPGTRAMEHAERLACARFRALAEESPDAGPPADAGLPEGPESICTPSSEDLEPLRLVQGPDGRFTPTTLP